MNESNKHRVLIAFGSNIGDSMAAYEQVQFMLKNAGFDDILASQPIRTAPVGGPKDSDQPEYLNAAILTSTTQSPQQTIQSLLDLEQEMGRVRSERWGARTVDLDLLLFGQTEVNDSNLVCPHPRMSYRRFVLEPAAEIAADMLHPTSGLTIAELLDHLNTRPNLVLWMGPLPESIRDLNHHTTPLDRSIRIKSSTECSEGFSRSTVNQENKLITLCEINHDTEFQALQQFAKLVVVPNRSNGDFQIFPNATRFAGATLQIDANQLDEKRELIAAIDAMS